jgi:ATP-binding cassette subfamily B protein
VLRRTAHFARPYLHRYALGFVLLLVTNGLSLWIPWLLRDAIRAMEREVDLRVIGGFALLMIAVALVQAVIRTLSRLALLGTSRRIIYDIRNLFFAHLQRLGSSFYDTQRTGDIMSRGVNDVRLVQSLYGPGVMNLMNTSIVYVAVLVLLLRVDVQLTLISLALYPVLFVVVNRLSRRIYARSLAVQEQLASISNRAQENISGIQQVKIFAQEDREIATFGELCAEYRRRNLSMTFLRGGMLSMIGALSGAATLIVLFIGGRFVIQGRIDFGDFVAFNAYLALLVWPTIALGWIINTLQRGAGAMRRIDEILAHAPDVGRVDADAGAGEGAAHDALDGDIEIRGLTFTYPQVQRETGTAPRAALHDVDLRIRRGSRVALVGSVGSGKSTLANLLARFYPVPAGTVFIGGVDINDIPLSRLRRGIGYVPQEAFLFSRSLRDNIALGHPTATDEDVMGAVDLARLAGDLEAFPHGLDTLVGERGYTLSGGQRQRATLARAMLGDPELLILDDSLSSVDADTERAILDALHDRTRERTLILISHRLSTLSGVDRIVVLDRGRVVEEGTHDELMARSGLYVGLFRRHLLEQRLTG